MINRILEWFRGQRKSEIIRERKTWDRSQDYELNCAVNFMDIQYYKDYLERDKEIFEGKIKGLNTPCFMSEFFKDDDNLLRQFIDYTTGKICLEIGPSVGPLISSFWWTKRNYIIEPLLDKIVASQKELLGYTIFDQTINYSQPAEKIIIELIGQIDGVVVCRNCLDHSPQWPFILNNIASYAQSGTYLLLWNDLFHLNGTDDGHYDMTQDIDGFKRLLNNVGFKIEREYDILGRDTINYGCVARKKS